ncbi:unnamed protein product [Acanthoscelides obtectus]|uniref:Uncharacterized protein n=1 Tax=Acanthoscelides obtectus TaxID=200917 RepID=A0A9P0QE55_ACAOB|nr:unnamed protein product [Acanthoscelides obtectus]CAK1688623.1 hypothetical protein AOBTE_LOCUS36772 [Acanthoscelides obtectus]
MLRQSMKWRQQWKLTELLKIWVPPEVLQKFHPSGTSGYDKGRSAGDRSTFCWPRRYRNSSLSMSTRHDQNDPSRYWNTTWR